MEKFHIYLVRSMLRYIIFFALLTLFCFGRSEAQKYPKAFAYFAPRPDYPPAAYRRLPKDQWPQEWTLHRKHRSENWLGQFSVG